MPPEAPALLTSQPRPLLSLRSEQNLPDSHNNKQLKKMEIKITRKKLIHILVFILACMSLFRLLRFAITSYSSSSRSAWANLSEICDSSRTICGRISSHTSLHSQRSKPITKKEFRFLSNLISRRAPCNLLIFGWEPQYRHLARINAAGTTIFLVDAPGRIKRLKRSNTTRVYRINYDVTAKEAYKLLKHGRDNIDCAPNSGPLESSTCKLALTMLPNVVYKQKWGVIIVDGPSSDGPEAPGRMPTIYTSSMLARAGNMTTNVVIHDVDRMIEKWFSREFLCEENMVSSKGRFWNFSIRGGEQANSTSFCTKGSPFQD